MFDCLIIGGGPAGIAAACQIKRYGFKSAIIEKSCVGGLVRNANLIENYPNYYNGISGEQFAHELESFAINSDVSVIKDTVILADYSHSFFHINTLHHTYVSKSLIVASGTKAKKNLGFPIDNNALTRIYYEIATLKNIQGKNIAIIGAGDAAFDYALNLSRKNNITILNRTDIIKSLGVIYERAISLDSIEYLANFRITQITSCEDKIMIHRNADETRQFDMIIAAIGREPNDGFLSNNLKKLYPNLDAYQQAGDVKNGLFRQCSIAVGDGVRAAMKINEFLKKECNL